MTKKAKKISARMKAYWARRREAVVNNLHLGEQQQNQTKSVKIDKFIAGVSLHSHAINGRLKLLTIAYPGGSSLTFTVEE